MSAGATAATLHIGSVAVLLIMLSLCCARKAMRCEEKLTTKIGRWEELPNYFPVTAFRTVLSTSDIGDTSLLRARRRGIAPHPFVHHLERAFQCGCSGQVHHGDVLRKSGHPAPPRFLRLSTDLVHFPSASAWPERPALCVVD